MKFRWRGWLAGAMMGVIAVVGAAAIAVESGLVEHWARGRIVRQIERKTGGRVEVGAFHFELRGLRIELDNLTLHGREAEGLPPLFHADKVEVGVRVVSAFEHKIALNHLLLVHPAVFVRMDPAGRSNIPAPPIRRAPGKPWSQQLLDLQISKLQLDGGTLLFNDAKAPLVAEGSDFEFAMEYEASKPGKEYYLGSLSWRGMQFVARRYLPFPSDLAAKFTLKPDSFTLDDLRWTLPHSQIEARAEFPSYRLQDLNFHFRGQLSLADLRTILRKPEMPDGQVDFTSAGNYGSQGVTMTGHYLARDIDMHYRWFHTKGIGSWGNFQMARGRLEMPHFEASVLGGALDGRLNMEVHGFVFTVQSHLQAASVATLFAAVENPHFPVQTLRWNGRVNVDSVSTWSRDFKHFRSRGESIWAPTPQTVPGEIPVTARLDYDYVRDQRAVQILNSEISTPSSQITLDGPFGARDSAVEVSFATNCLIDWDDFINYLRGPKAPLRQISGSMDWKGRILGPLGGPTFVGHFHALQARYAHLYWDFIEGDLNYSPDAFRLSDAQVTRGGASAVVNLWLQLDGTWGFLPENQWSLDVGLSRDPTDPLQEMLGTSYPVSGLLTGRFHGGGTRAEPVFDGSFELDNGKARGFAFNRFRGQINVSKDEIRFSQADLELDSGRASGNLAYQLRTRQIAFSLAGSSLDLSRVRPIQSHSLPVGGRLSFNLHGQGPLAAPTGQGNVQLTDLRFGNEILDSFEGRLEADGQHLQLDLRSTKTPGKLVGRLKVELTGDYPMTGEMIVYRIDLDPFISAGLHLAELTGHSSVDGRFGVSGALRRPETLLATADLSRVSLNYEYVKLENDGPVRLRYRHNQVQVEQAKLRGPDTDFTITGEARFDRSRPLDLRLMGTINLRLAAGLFPGLDARGSTELNAAIDGTFSKPVISGRARIVDASVHYGDFPAGLSHMNGEVVFDRSRLVFDNLAAEAGGGSLVLSGSAEYGQGPLRYEVNAAATRIRIRYPQGLSWLVSGKMTFSGTTKGALLSGNLVVRRVVLGPNVDFASLILASREPVIGPETTSAYLRNLQFDVEGDTGPGTRIEWGKAYFETRGKVHIRGTWEHPVILGFIQLLNGEMPFRGNTYQVTRGDINFSNPFRFDPVLNVEATTTINPYEITLDFTGPASHMQLSYRSDPPLPAGDIIALLALGTPGEETALSSPTTTAPNFGATALLTEAITSTLGGPIERLFGISHFRVDPFLAGTATDQNAAARVTIQQQVTHNLSVTYSTNATSNQQQVIEVEYAIRHNVSIVALRDINGTFGIDVEFTRHFK